MLKWGLEPGLYLNLAPSIYHLDQALSRTDILALNDTPFTYWEQSGMNPDRKVKRESQEMNLGDAFHCQLFEPARFEREYGVFPTEPWNTGKKMVSKEDHDAIVASIKVLRAGKNSSLFLSGGVSEVTVVFDFEGLRFRTRHDYFTPVVTSDFKSTFSLAEWHLKKAFDKYGYDVQMFLYKLARERFKEQFRAGEAHVYGDIDPAFFHKFMASEISDFIFIFQRKSAPFPYEALFPEDDTERSGEDKTYAALQVFQTNMQKYGVKPWEVSDGKVKRFSMQYGIVKEN